MNDDGWCNSSVSLLCPADTWIKKKKRSVLCQSYSICKGCHMSGCHTVDNYIKWHIIRKHHVSTRKGPGTDWLMSNTSMKNYREWNRRWLFYILEERFSISKEVFLKVFLKSLNRNRQMTKWALGKNIVQICHTPLKWTTLFVNVSSVCVKFYFHT